jgi:glycosyltransferase involved in cell wall biosynthesis
MKILHLISQHPDSTGSGIYLRNIIREADLAGHQNFLIAGLSDADIPHIEGINPESCSYVRFGSGDLDFLIPGMSDIMPYPSTRFSSLTAEQLDRYEHCFAQAMTALVEKNRPDIIHSHHLWMLTSLTRRLFPDIPMVTSCHSTDLRQSVLCPHIKQRVLEPCRRIDRILSLSGDQRSNIVEMYGINPDNISVVGGGFDDRIFSPKIKKAAPPVKVLYAGKLSFAKGVDCLLRAFNSLPDKDVELHLAGSGSGDEERYCLELATGLGERVKIHGHIDQRKLAALMADCHISLKNTRKVTHPFRWAAVCDRIFQAYNTARSQD